MLFFNSFFNFKANSNRVLTQADAEIIELKLIYEKLNEKLPFVALVTSSFPQEKVNKPPLIKTKKLFY